MFNFLGFFFCYLCNVHTFPIRGQDELIFKTSLLNMVNSMVLCLWCLTSEQMAQGLGSIFGLFVEFLPSACLGYIYICVPCQQNRQTNKLILTTNNRGMKGTAVRYIFILDLVMVTLQSFTDNIYQ